MRTIRVYMPRGEIHRNRYTMRGDAMLVHKYDRNYKKLYFQFFNLNAQVSFITTVTFSPKEHCRYIADYGKNPILIFQGKELNEIHVDALDMRGVRYDISIFPQLTSVPSKYYYGKHSRVTAHCGTLRVNQWFSDTGAPIAHYALCEICGRREDLTGTIPIERIMHLGEHIMTHDTMLLAALL